MSPNKKLLKSLKTTYYCEWCGESWQKRTSGPSIRSTMCEEQMRPVDDFSRLG